MLLVGKFDAVKDHPTLWKLAVLGTRYVLLVNLYLSPLTMDGYRLHIHRLDMQVFERFCVSNPLRTSIFPV